MGPLWMKLSRTALGETSGRKDMRIRASPRSLMTGEFKKKDIC